MPAELKDTDVIFLDPSKANRVSKKAGTDFRARLELIYPLLHLTMAQVAKKSVEHQSWVGWKAHIPPSTRELYREIFASSLKMGIVSIRFESW